jgi:hypothetical protein
MTDPGTPVLSVLETAHDPYFVQKVKVSSQFATMPRGQFLTRFLAGKSVLHVGYADWPITDVHANLHVVLDGVCARLDGVDPHDEAAAAIRPHVRGELYRSLDEVTGSYDIVLIPEVVEHVGNIEEFLADVDRVDFETALVTVPDAYSCMQRHFDLVRRGEEETFFEVVHPDHNCWFTPYTFRNLLTKYTTWSVTDTVWFFNGISLMLFANKEA